MVPCGEEVGEHGSGSVAAVVAVNKDFIWLILYDLRVEKIRIREIAAERNDEMLDAELVDMRAEFALDGGSCCRDDKPDISSVQCFDVLRVGIAADPIAFGDLPCVFGEIKASLLSATACICSDESVGGCACYDGGVMTHSFGANAAVKRVVRHQELVEVRRERVIHRALCVESLGRFGGVAGRSPALGVGAYQGGSAGLIAPQGARAPC